MFRPWVIPGRALRGAIILCAFTASAHIFGTDDVGGSTQASGGPHAVIQWLDKMNGAIARLNYQGTFVYMEGDDVQTMRITHIVDDTGIRERLVSLSGPQREIQRDAGGVSWVFEDNRQVMEDSANAMSYFPSFEPESFDSLREHYRMSVGEPYRIAGKTVHTVNITPKDQFRYGYVLWLESETGLLLKWALFDKRRNPLAQLMFTEIRMGDEVDDSELIPAKGRLEYGTVESTIPARTESSEEVPAWTAGRLPPGFELMEYSQLAASGDGVFEHLVYSDGFATVSVYVETSPESGSGMEGTSRLGTTHAFSRKATGVSITVIGDVPARTVQFIGNAVRQESSSR